MKSTRLYVKKHSFTGLLYFGKTTRDPLKYVGSGRRWSRHLNKHGKTVDTLWVSQPFTDEADIEEFALLFSDLHDIVKSPKWANEKPENGLDGGREKGCKGRSLSETEINNLRERMISNNPMSTTEGKSNHQLAMQSPALRARRKEIKTGNKNVRGKSWYNNGEVTKMFLNAPDGWTKGRLNPHWNHKRAYA